MTYEHQLASLLEEILNQFETDLLGPGWTHETDEGDLFEVNTDLNTLLDRANDLIYGTGGDGGDESGE